MIEDKKSIGSIDSSILADYIVFKSGQISHLKLQKLLYYIQAFHLAYFDVKLFDDKFEAWVHGPVSRKVFGTLKNYSLLYNELHYVQTEGEIHPETVVKEQLTAEQKELIDDIISEYGKLSGLELEQLTHAEPPWNEAREGLAPPDKCTNTIDEERMKEYYKTVLYAKN